MVLRQCLRAAPRLLYGTRLPYRQQPQQWQLGLMQLRHYAEKVVQVPQMAESITEGTLKQFSKQVGDHVEQDEEIATIETDKIDVSVNAPEAGTIKEFLVKEEDTVTVGQDLLKLELGGDSSSEGKEVEAKQEPKAPASSDQATSSQPEGGQEQSKPQQQAPKQEEKKPESPKAEKKPEPPIQETKAPPPKQETKTPPPKQETKPQPPKKDTEQPRMSDSPFGSREERRVSYLLPLDMVLTWDVSEHGLNHESVRRIDERSHG